jgi:uncharacterized hydrophobic protein (TIGR00271 family)
MSDPPTQTDGPDDRPLSLTPLGKLGFRGRAATPEEQASVLGAFFYEGARRVPYLRSFYVLMLLSATIAAFGLVNDTSAVVIGAMLVAPLMTPILAIAASVVQGWPRRILESLAIVGTGALAAIAVGIVIGLFTPSLHTGLPLPDEMLARTNPNMVDLGIAIAAGAAGGFVAVRTDAGGALPGVGIAVALVPPLAVVGMTIGIGQFDLAIGALLLFMTNLVAIVLAAGLVFVAAGFGAYLDQRGGHEAKVAWIVIAVGIVIVGIPLFIHSMQRLEQGGALVSVSNSVSDWAPDVTLNDIDIEPSADGITVTIAITGLEEPPGAESLASSLVDTFGRDVTLDIVFVPVERVRANAP